MPITGTCHCGNVSYSYDDTPKWTTSCNCSMCRRLGAHWIYSEIGNITIKAASDATVRYTHGDMNLAFHSCKNCGCTTHWENLVPEKVDRMAVNLNLAEPAVAAKVPVRHFDGADSWEFLD